MAGLISSYVASHPREPELHSGLTQFARYLTMCGIAVGAPLALEERIVAQAAQLQHAVDRRQVEAELFRAGRPPRPARRRHGSAFCAVCRRYKDYRKECPHCRQIEFTV